MGTVNIKKSTTDATIVIFDNFYKREINVDANEFDIIRSYFHSLYGNNDIADDFTAVVDGNYFTPYMHFNETTQSLEELKSTTIEQGDAKYMGIAAASILAKTSRDAYMIEMCDKYPLLDDYYGFRKNVGYGTKQHREGIIEHGITRWHRRTFGQACRNANIIDIPEKKDS